jgi:ferredoxin
MMGIAQFTLDVPIIKGSSGVVVLSRDEVKETLPQECISCARCVDVCPMNLMPTLIVSYVENGRWDLAINYRFRRRYELYFNWRNLSGAVAATYIGNRRLNYATSGSLINAGVRTDF